MTPDEFKSIRKDLLKIGTGRMAQALGISRRLVVYYEAGERPISGPVETLMGLIVASVHVRSRLIPHSHQGKKLRTDVIREIFMNNDTSCGHVWVPLSYRCINCGGRKYLLRGKDAYPEKTRNMDKMYSDRAKARRLAAAKERGTT